MKLTKIAILAGLALLTAGCAPATDNTTSHFGHDGSRSSPAVLNLGVPFSGKVGAYWDGTDSESCYQFNTASSTEVMLSITGASVAHSGKTTTDAYWAHLFSNADWMTGYVGAPTIVDGVSPIFIVDPDTNYYLSILNMLDKDTHYTIEVGPVPADLNEGTDDAAGSIPLTLGVGRASYTTNWQDGKSYYWFNTGEYTSVTIDYGIPQLDSTLYSSSDFSTGVESLDTDWEVSKYTVTDLTPYQDYYLEVDNNSFDAAKVDFTLKVTGNGL